MRRSKLNNYNIKVRCRKNNCQRGQKIQLLNESVSGVFIIAATPFKSDGALDLNSAERLVDFYISKGVTGITILGMMGEANKLSSE